MDSQAPRRTVLGYHIPGEHHYFSALPERVQMLGEAEGEDFHSPEQFASLVTGIHEHYHLLQELFQGFSWWRASVLDDLAWRVAQGVGATAGDSRVVFPLWCKPAQPPQIMTIDYNDPLSLARKAAVELDTIGRTTVSDVVTRQQLEMEVKDSPSFGRLLTEDAYSLTTLDLLECHAAMLTEIRVSQMLAAQPERFDPQVVDELAPLFRISAMPSQYGKPLRSLLHILATLGLRFEMPPTAHPFYQRIEHGQLYFIASFLLDYSLHLPPDPLRILKLSGQVQDLHPPLRFLSLAVIFASEIGQGREEDKRVLTDEKRLFSDASPRLAQLVNSIRPRTRPNQPDTFFPLDEVTRQWRDIWMNWPLRDSFAELHALRLRCVDRRAEDPGAWHTSSPLWMATDVGLPRVIITSRGMTSLPYFAETSGGKIDEEELKIYLQRASEKWYGGLGAGEWDFKETNEFPVTLVPFRFIDECMRLRMLHEAAQMILHSGQMRCPLTESLGRFVPCAPRNRECETITAPGQLPTEGCRLRAVFQGFMGGADQFDLKVKK